MKSTTMALAAAVAALTACGGGGGGGGVREVPFTSFPSAPNQTVVMTGISESIGGTTDVSGTQVVSLDPNTVMDGGSSTMRLTFDGAGNMFRIAINAPQSNLSFGPGTIDCGDPGLCTGLSGLNEVVVVNPAFAPPFAWNYQTFGVWLQTDGTNFRAGAISAGAVTPAMPTTAGTVNFSGMTSGFYVSGTTPYATASSMTADVDFFTRSINFATQNTTTVPFSGGNPTLDPNLNFSGNVTYASGSSQFTVPVTAVNGMTGNVNGRFYGPAAKEMGGVYSLTGAGSQQMLGGFGATRP